MDAQSFINFYLLPGIVLGAVYALGAIAVTLVFAIMRHGHLAHGDLATLGAFLVLTVTAFLGLSPFMALPVAALLSGLVAVLIDRLFYAHLRGRAKIITTIASLGIALMLRSVVQIVWGVNTTSYSAGIVRPENWFGVRIKIYEVYTLLVAIALVVALQLFLMTLPPVFIQR